ncbi:unnamed protein product [marine sediment metagenome]|uniref:Uncharacterized protein n=1 Tax=marine sediment metagenome TaxID=412755 RepID=X0RZ53_9ZZZZ
MGMSTHVIGFKPPDEKWAKMKAVWDACEVSDITTPETVYNFFEGEPPDDSGVRIELETDGCVTQWKGDMEDGFEVDVSKLPPDVTVIRFYNAW